MTFADADEDPRVPLCVVVTLVSVPILGMAVIVTVVPTGMFAAETATVTGLAVLFGRSISGWEKEPLVLDGTFTPAIEVMLRVGMLDRIALPGWP